MTKKRYSGHVILAFLIAIAASVSIAQTEIAQPNFKGSIVDKAERAPIARAHVWIHEDNGRDTYGAIPDQKGHFEYNLPEGYYDVLVSSPGFAPFCKKVWIRPGVPITLNVVMDVDRDTLQN